MIQFCGVFALFAGLTLLWPWSPWLLIVVGVLLLIVPEVWEAVMKR